MSSDWESLGLSTSSGFKLDVRYDYLDQNQLRSGTGKISPQAASGIVNTGSRNPANDGPQEVEKYTKNHYVTITGDYNFNPSWGVQVQVPYIDRSHATLGTSSDGVSPADEAYESGTKNIGDIKVIGRFQGFTEQHNVGVLFGLKLPTGDHRQTGISTDPAALGDVAAIDRGLQPGTGTTDVILGVYYHDAINKDWGFFSQGVVQTALNAKDDYRPGNGLNLNGGLRYTGFAGFTPQLQLNARYVARDSGAEADTVSTGGTLVYLSPGVVVPVNKKLSAYSFVQIPIYQNVNGVQLAPRFTASVGARYSF
ncbi:hypothetical protein ZMTM_07580 [Methyloradius palustris]|uniref:TonB-dependent receptor n=1 Tax=Methyloradius palustris TaxID=2778876 RepID=A0A8D5FYI8_9PROT|nr:hypothetical protein ZMTM_07580 [Methyloradius palustris]